MPTPHSEAHGADRQQSEAGGSERGARMARIRARRLRHEEEMLSVHWFTPAILAARWGLSETTVRAIPADRLPYKEFGEGKTLHRRRYHPDAVAAYEADQVRGAA